MINDFFGYGEFLQVSQESERNYPAMIVNATAAPSETWYINYTMEVMLLEYVNDEQENKERAVSNMRQILNDLEETISYSDRWQAFSKIAGGFNAVPAIQKGQDKSYGWVATFTLKVKKRHGICDIQALMPEYDFDTGLITGPTCDPVTITGNTTLMETADSGDAYVFEIKDTDGATVGTWNALTSTWVVPAAGGDPAENQVNGAAKTDIPAGGSKDFQIEYANGDPVVVTEVSDSATVFSGTIPNDAGSKDVYYNRAWLKSGTSYSTYDEEWRAANGANAYNEAIPTLSPIQQLDFTGGLRDKVLYLNFYGHKFRFVGINGGYYNPADGIYYDVNGVASTKLIEFPLFNITSYWVIDTLTGHKVPAAGFSNKSYSQNLINAAAATWDGDTDFFVFSRDELYQLADASYNNCIHPSFRPPFNNAASNWSCTPWMLAPTTNALAFNGSQGGGTTQQAYGYAGFSEFYGRIELTGFVTQP